MVDGLPLVRKAEPADRGEIVAMVKDHHAENEIVFALDEDQVNNALNKHYNRTGGIVGVIGTTGSLEACCALVFSDLWYSKAWHICELFNYVKPEYRNSNNADALMEFAKQCSLTIGLPLIAGVITSKQTAAKTRLYRRRYGSAAGAFFLFNAPHTEPMPDRDFMMVFEPEEDRQRRRREERKRARKENGLALMPALQTTNATGLVMQ
jgi:GNAT superfamily N-acetyltransferase